MAPTEVYDFHKNMLEEQLRAFQKFKRGFELSRSWAPETSIGKTPHTVVYEEGKCRLLHYKAQTKETYKVPLLIVFSLINRSYILDLKPGKSIVEKMVQSGYDVYLIDWGVTGPADQYLTLDDYINRYMYRMVEFIRRETDMESIHILGYCMGGTMTGMYAALYPEKVRNLLLMAAPFDFETQGSLLNLWADKRHFDVDKLIQAMGGNIPPWFLQSCFTILKPMQNMLDKYIKFFEKIEDDAFVDDFLTLEYWLNDNIPLAGPVYKQFVQDCFHNNILIKNEMRIGQHRVDLGQITCPVLSIVAEHDHLVPPESSLAINDVVGSSEKKVMIFPAGHIGLSVSGRAMRKLWPDVAEWLAERSHVEGAKDKRPAPQTA